MSDWQPISTAPKGAKFERPMVLLYCPVAGVVRGHWDGDEYGRPPRPHWTNDSAHLWGKVRTRADQPTHWMPLPSPPEAARGTSHG